MDNDTAASSGDAAKPPTGAWIVAILVIIVVIAGLVAFAVGAGPTDNDTRVATAGLPDLQQDLAAHEWLLERADSSLAGDDDPNPVTLVLADGQVTGSAPCNRYFGRFTVDEDDDTLTITELAQTNKSCDSATMRAEDEYLAVLQRVRDIDLPGGYDRRRLVLTNAEGDRLAYQAVDIGELAVGRWYVVNVAGDDALESVAEGTEPTVDLRSDGDLLLETGCNEVRGRYQLGVDIFAVGELSRTSNDCDDPRGVMAQEAALLDALESGRRIEVVPGQLTILDGDGRTVLVAVDERPRR